MKNLILSICIILTALFTVVESAEAARFGGGRSFGMQRSTPSRQAASPVKPAPRPANAAQPQKNWLGPIAGIATAIGLTALLSHLGLGEGFANIVMIFLLLMAAVFVFRLLTGRRDAETRPSMQFAPAAPASPNAPPRAPAFPLSGTASPVSSIAAPADFDAESFLRAAKTHFIRLQAANDACNLDDIREFTTPEIFAEISLQIGERYNAEQKTDVVTLEAQLIDLVTENDRHIASVHFTGMIRETADGGAIPFSEIWHLVKPVDGNHGWIVAGIQQQ